MFEISGVKIATINCNIKGPQDRDDVLLVKFDDETQVAGVFARSSFTAAPVNWCKQNIKNGIASALIVNSGNANSFTSQQGDESLNRVVSALAKTISKPKETIFMSSTGVIGEFLDDKKITDKLDDLNSNLNSDKDSWQKAAKAIMTTDLKPKYSCVTTKIDNTQIKINGIAKGSGMISPNMATMLSYIFTDANIKSNILQQILSDISERTFNAITVDSDQSTNDTVMLFATNKAGNKEITDINSPLLKEFKNKLEELMLDLSKQIVIDGEGATKLIEIEVKGASSQEAAKNIAFQVANSPLVKTAIAGEDPNWGRIVMAIGKSQEQINQDDLDIKIGDFNIVKNGSLSSNYKEDQVHQYLKNDTIKIDINLQKDNGSAFTVWTCDLTEGYIKINKDYRS